MSAAAFTDEVVTKVENHGVYRIGYPDRMAAERLVKQLRQAIAAERAAWAELVDSVPALIEVAAGRAPVSLGVIRRAERAIANLREGAE